MEADSDEQLMAQVMLGDRAALSLLVERHHALLIGYLYRMVSGDRALAEDLTQETFVRLITSKSYVAIRPFKPWLYAIATNLARDHFKSAATHYSVGDPDTLGTQGILGTPGVEGRTWAEAEAPGPENEVLQAETGQEVAESIAQLSPEYRSALLLRFYGDMSLQEIAEALDIPVGTVKSRLSVGCRRLRDLLAPSMEKSEMHTGSRVSKTRTRERADEKYA